MKQKIKPIVIKSFFVISLFCINTVNANEVKLETASIYDIKDMEKLTLVKHLPGFVSQTESPSALMENI